MRHYNVYKIIFSSILLFLALSLPAYFTEAQTAGALRSKIDEKSAEIEKLEAEIKSYQSQLVNLGQQKNSLGNALAELDITKKKLNADISVTQKKIDQTNLKITALGSQINVKEDSISNAREAIVSDIKKTNELEETSLIENMLSEEDFTTVWNDIDNMMNVREKIRANIKELQNSKVELEDTRKETIDAKNELTSLKSKLGDQKKIIDQNAKEKATLLAQTKNSEVNYQKLVASQTAKKAALEQEVRDYESQLKYILDPKTLPKNRPLSWPLDSVFVTQLFGKTVDSVRLYASGTHSGVDFRATVGTPVRSMADGIIKGIGNTDTTCAGASFGKWVFIVYDNGLSSTFGHLSLAKATVGEKVKRGEIVAYSGATGRVTGPHLHVTVYAPNAAEVKTLPSKACLGKTLTQPIAAINGYLDPMQYLPPYSAK
jgi:murein DD-endopeptidase MepM/ murein hydrolase activator NlpD